MFPILVSTAESEPVQDNGRRSLKVTFVGLAAMLALGIMLLFSGSVAASVAGVAAVVIASIALAVMGVSSASRVDNAGKHKRGLDGLDMYTLIDQMVDDLDEDEMAYLRRRLEQKEDHLPEQMANLLEQREEDRQHGRR